MQCYEQNLNDTAQNPFQSRDSPRTLQESQHSSQAGATEGAHEEQSSQMSHRALERKYEGRVSELTLLLNVGTLKCVNPSVLFGTIWKSSGAILND